MAGARIEVEEGKENPMDFTLWKAAKPGEPEWESPWGMGRPGWHIECSAMSTKYLGPSLDIHGGGQDLIFPHHENEIAQSEAATGVKPFARYWLHNGLLQLGEEKMSKSLGNLVTIREVLENYNADALRLFVLSSHYRSPLTYTDEGLASMQRGAERLSNAALAPSTGANPHNIDLTGAKDRFIEAMDDDFNSPRAIAVLFDLVRDVNRTREEGADVSDAQELLKELAGVLGLTLTAAGREDHLAAKPFVDLLVATRAELRTAKQWALADRIRDQLGELGITLEDTPQGTIWRARKG